MKLKVVVYCIRNGCSEHFEAEVPVSDVSAHIGNGGSIEIEWPVPDPPEGWGDHLSSTIYCPRHK